MAKKKPTAFEMMLDHFEFAVERRHEEEATSDGSLIEWERWKKEVTETKQALIVEYELLQAKLKKLQEKLRKLKNS